MKKETLVLQCLLFFLFLLQYIAMMPIKNCGDCENNSTMSEDRLKRSAMETDYVEYYDDISLDIMDERQPVVQSAPPDLNINTNVKSLTLSKGLDINVQLPDEPSKEAPDYMMELYNKFSKNHLSNPSSNIIRSFTNINVEAPTHQPSIADISGSKTRVHTMVFNITSISAEEGIDLAELRLYTLVERDRHMYIGVDRKVSIFEVNDNGSSFYLIDSKHIYGRDSGWEKFDVTPAVRRWVEKLNPVQILEIRIESVFHSMSLGDLDIQTKSRNKQEPLLVVFSNDLHRKKLHETERHELLTHEMDMYDVQDDFDGDGGGNDNSTNTNSNSLNRVKRRGRNHSVCRRKRMRVKFKDMGWDSWIIAPREYEAYQCTGRCFLPMSDHLSPTKHAIIQNHIHAMSPRKVSRPCCVPTKLDPISVLYIDEQGIITYKYKYDGMVVSECGCR